MTREIAVHNKSKLTPKHFITAEILKCFALKLMPTDDAMQKVIKVFAEEAIRDGFLPEEISKACAEVSRDAGLRKVIYADIYEAASALRRERLRKIQNTQELKEAEERKAEQARWDALSPEEKEAELKKFREETAE